jgi:hypothetical protein
MFLEGFALSIANLVVALLYILTLIWVAVRHQTSLKRFN